MRRKLEHRATRFLARAAFEAGAIEPVDFEFILDFPARAAEVLAFTRWLSS
jgi:hypothetical protein